MEDLRNTEEKSNINEEKLDKQMQYETERVHKEL